MSELLHVDQTNLLYEANYQRFSYRCFSLLSDCVFVHLSLDGDKLYVSLGILSSLFFIANDE